ncbi:MAG TPA: Hsp20/alpha crystallin family protein [Candidatus Acidoferrales bacterium]|nr:Hsp20/alpha crystallin family protein [Candidatus Acidoferrales bacterium]
MEEQAATGLVRAPEIVELSGSHPFFEHARKVKELIARRAYELFEARGHADGLDLEDWFRAKAEILLTVPVDVTETETELTVRAEVPGFSERDLQVQVAPHSVCITGKRQMAVERTEGKTVYSERRPDQVFRVLDLSSQLEPDSVNAALSGSTLEVKVLKAATRKKIAVRAMAASA